VAERPIVTRAREILSREEIALRIAELPPELQEEAAALALVAFGAADSENDGRVLTFREFVSLVNHRYQWYQHCIVLADVLQRVADDELKRVLVFMPPRHGKSETVSRLFPAYYLYRHPDRFVGINSYSADLAYTFSRLARQHFLTAGGELKKDSAQVKHWETVEGGGLWAAGVGGPITGKGFHLGMIDDPLKNSEQANSPTIRLKQHDWYDSTFSTREEPGGAIVITQTRWHEEDIAGYVLSKEKDEPENWHIVNFSAIREERPMEFPKTCTVEPDWRALDEPLCPERYPLEKLRKIERRIRAYFWNALYQQRPAAEEGNMFKAEMVLMEPKTRTMWKWPQESVTEAIIVWDTANKAKRTNDFTAGGLGFRATDGYIYVLPLCIDRMEVPRVEKRIGLEWAKWRLSLSDVLVANAIEDGAGTAVTQTLRAKLGQRDLDRRAKLNGEKVRPPVGWKDHEWDLWCKAPPINLVEFKPIDEKVVNASLILSTCQARGVRLLDSPYSREALSQLLGFPGAHDDFVDVFVNIVKWFTGLWGKGAAAVDETALDEALDSAMAGMSPEDREMMAGLDSAMAEALSMGSVEESEDVKAMHLLMQ
jgi:hypothetical protein